MDAIKALSEAVDKAKSILTSLIDTEWETTERSRLEKLSKKELIEELMNAKLRAQKTATVEECVISILVDEKCDFLSYDMIAALVNRARPGTKTTPKCIAWYFSRENSKREDARPVRLRRKLPI